MDPIWIVAIVAALAISIYTGLRLFMLLERIRRESSRSYEVAVRLEEDWENFARKQKEDRKRFEDRMERFEADVKDRVDRFEKVATGTRERLLKLEEYLKEFFEVELKSVFESFDKTVASILEEMKVELLRGVDRIEEIQAVVDSKSYAQDRILDGEGSVYKLIADTPGEGDAAEPEAAPEDEAPAPEPDEAPAEPPEGPQVEPPRMKLEADDTE